ncbi:hypothetical protein D1159_03685 [Pseudoflavonifractor sp. 524-17]|uniref:hypothetical protein n=1 Tax=Pseudoflavonifractor sp. 524-17 TaxID=2304577 RepID=UPI00137B612E|nr:hypothetical protein [Pseudoflavonifractor sp. 524-17]NCE63701.1 hypothetical protein [Pseudoflavonifractor sp. 524-17]
MIYIGIDPGKDGAVAFLYEEEPPVIMTFEHEVYAKALSIVTEQLCKCCLERVWTMPGEGHKSQGALMENFGFIKGLLTAYSIPYELVTPQKWKKEFQITGDKNSSIAVCKRLFPGVSLKRTDRCKKDHDGMAEALLMAEYARRRL